MKYKNGDKVHFVKGDHILRGEILNDGQLRGEVEFYDLVVDISSIDNNLYFEDIPSTDIYDFAIDAGKHIQFCLESRERKPSSIELRSI